MLKFSIVVLHYQTFDDTVECVNSILQNIRYENLSIIVVNNGSSNDSGELLEEEYHQNPNVHYIHSDKNLGFAKGNNIGFSYAKYELESDFICLLNNDTIVEQKDFVSMITERFQKKPFHIMGPDIVSTINGQHQNPEIETCTDVALTQKKQQHYKRLLFLNKLAIEEPVVKLKRKLFPAKEKKEDFDNIDYRTEQDNVKLHGSCLIFSKDYIDRYDGLYPKTFMYGEESILNFIRKRDGLKSVYFPQIKIYHKEDSSTNFEFPKDAKKRKFYYKNLIHSLELLLTLMKTSS